MKLLVTGGCGFIGSHYIKHHLEHNPQDEIVNLDKLTYAGRKENLQEIESNPNYSFQKGDICNPQDVEQAMDGCNGVINFAAESHVDRSIDSAAPFIETNVQGTLLLLEASRKNDVKKFLHVSCYDEKTRALTPEGLKEFHELKEGDTIFSINPTTKNVEIKPVEKVIIQDYNGPMVHFKNKRTNILVTPNHRMFVLNTKKKLVIEEAETASKRSVFFMPRGKWVGKEEEFFNVPGHGIVSTADLLYILGVFIGDGFTAYQEKEIPTKSGLNRTQFLMLARNNDGRFNRMQNATGYVSLSRSHRIFFDIPESDKSREKIENVLTNLDINHHAHKGKAGTHLYCTSKPWFDLFSECGKGAHNKQIPKWALEYSPKYLKYLFDGLMDSDGHNQKVYHTVSKKLVAQFCELCIKLSLNPNIGKRHSVSFLNGRKIEGSAYWISVSVTQKSISRTRIKKVKYEGKIWCLKVKDNKNFVTEREGRLDFCGNTDEVYGQIMEGAFTEKSPFAPRSPYAASKAAADLLAQSFFTTYNLPVCITRSSNNYGPNQFPEKVIPLFVTNLLRGKKVPVYGTGKNVRDWLYVKDNCEGIETVLKKGKNGEAYNIGGGNEKNNLELTHMILAECNAGEEMIQFVEDRKGHDWRYALDYAKISEELGWKPKTPFEKGLKETVQWYRQNEWWWKPLVGK